MGISRAEFERHKDDAYAHAEARAQVAELLAIWQGNVELRIRRLELWIAALGALAGIAAFAAGVAGTLLVQGPH